MLFFVVSESSFCRPYENRDENNHRMLTNLIYARVSKALYVRVFLETGE